MQHAPIDDATRNRLEQVGMGNAPEVVREVGVHHFPMAAKPSFLHLDHRLRLDRLEVLTIHARRALVGAALGVGVRQDVLAADFVVEGVEAIAGFSLRFRVQCRLQFLNTLRSC